MKESQTAKTIKWIATGLTLAGSLCVSLNIDPLNIILLNLGSLLFLIWGFLIKEKAMITVNAGLLSIYILGLLLRI
jgi:hypothetical protein